MKKSRELTSHTYNSETAEKIADSIRLSYYGLLTDLALKLENERGGSHQNSIFT